MMSLIQMSLQAAAMICFAALIRALGRRWLPNWSFQALWGLALLRLLAPLRVESPLSAYGAFERLWRAMTPGPGIAPRVIDAGQAIAPPAAEPFTGLVQHVPTSAPAGFPWLLVWGLGAALVGAFFLIMHLRGRRVYAEALPLSSARVAGRAVSIRVSDRVDAPLTYGVLRPVVLLPKSLMRGGDAYRYVLAHELAHIRRFDVVKKGLLAAALIIHWFNPLVWAMFILANRDMELGCDASVLRQFGNGARATYATMLLDLMERRGRLTPLTSHFSVNATEERIWAIMKHNHKASRLWIFIALALMIATASALATSAPPAALEEAAPYLEEADGWTAEELEVWIEAQRAALTQSIGSRFWDEDTGWYTLTQEDVDEAVARYQDMLSDVRRGAYLSRDMTMMEDIGAPQEGPVRNGDFGDPVSGQRDVQPVEEAATTFGSVSIQKSESGGYSAAIQHKNGILRIGPTNSRAEFDAALQLHLSAAVAEGLITDAEAAYIEGAFAAEPDAPDVVEEVPALSAYVRSAWQMDYDQLVRFTDTFIGRVFLCDGVIVSTATNNGVETMIMNVGRPDVPQYVILTNDSSVAPEIGARYQAYADVTGSQFYVNAECPALNCRYMFPQ